MNTSQGYHTFTVYLKRTKEEAKEIYKCFHDCDKVLIIPSKRNKTNMFEPEHSPNGYIDANYFNISYKVPIGIRWVLKFDDISYTSYGGYETAPCSIKAIINPKLLVGMKDYVMAANHSYLDQVITNFNLETEKISPLLGKFHDYSLNRIDYCINFYIAELGVECTSEQMMILIKRSNIPSNMEEWMKYSITAHRKKSEENFYLTNNSITVNCYDKDSQLKKKYPDCPNIEDAKNIIRFEIQCKYPNIYLMEKAFRSSWEFSNVINEMLSDDVSEMVIRNYYRRIIGKGDYYTLDRVRKIVESHNYKMKKEHRLIEALQLVNRCRGISKAMSILQGKALDDFKRSLRELADIGINPVTIPKEWNMKFIPNLLDAYNKKIEAHVEKDYMDELMKTPIK